MTLVKEKIGNNAVCLQDIPKGTLFRLKSLQAWSDDVYIKTGEQQKNGKITVANVETGDIHTFGESSLVYMIYGELVEV